MQSSHIFWVTRCRRICLDSNVPLPFPQWRRWACHWRWGCTPAAEKGPETPPPVPPLWNAALRGTNRQGYTHTQTHNTNYMLQLMSPKSHKYQKQRFLYSHSTNEHGWWCEQNNAYQRMRGPGWGAVCMCAGQQMLWCPDSWWGEAETAGIHNKPDEHHSAEGDWLLAGEPENKEKKTVWEPFTCEKQEKIFKIRACTARKLILWICLISI